MSEPISRYSRSTIAIHWLTAAGVTLAVALGWRMADAGGTERESIQAWHMSAAVTILLLTIARIATRVLSRLPPAIGSRRERLAASWVHGAFYVALIVIPLLGWLIVSASSSSLNKVFGFVPLPVLTAVAGSTAVAGFAENAHRILAYGLCILIVVHIAAAFRHQLLHPSAGLARILPGARRILSWRVASLATVLVLLFTLGNGAADRFLPEALRLVHIPESTRNAPIDPRKAHVFATIQPILDQKCASCHGGSSRKGGLKLDTFASVLLGGEGGKVIVPGKPDESELVRRIMMPPTDKNAMPPSGKTPLTPAESQLLLWWIGAGADDSTTILAANAPPIVQNILQGLGVSAESAVLARDVASPDARTLAVLRADFEVRFLYRGKGLLAAQPRYDRVADQGLSLEPLVAVSDQLVRLDLSRSRISGQQFISLSKLRNLQRLNLAGTAADDASVRQLQDLPYLEVLNMFGTQVTDESIATLARMPSLMTVYLSGTAVTSAAVEKLRESHPGLSVVWTPDNAD